MAKLSNTPADRFAKAGPDSKEELSAGAKTIKQVRLHIGQAAEIGPAGPGRIYTRDYGKKQDTEKDDLVGPFLGNPLRL